MVNQMIDINPYAEVSLAKYKHNMEEVKKMLSDNTKIMAIVKANAYGHGAIEISRAANEVGINHFGVATLEEGIELRENGITGEILILGHISPSDINKVINYDLSITISSIDFYRKLIIKESLKVHVKIDTGLSRNGIYMQHSDDIDYVIEALKTLSEDEDIVIMGLFTHFASADSNEDFTRNQLSLFNELINKVKLHDLKCGLIHAANSAATLLFPDAHFDMVRIGLLGYGIQNTRNISTIKPIMSLKACLVQIKDIRKGDTVGYGNTYIAESNMTIGVVNIGYADGLSRALSNNIEFTLKEKKVKCIGRISMDVFAIDLFSCNAELYDRVSIFGDPSDGEQLITKLSSKLNTIEYEIFCLVGRRIQRNYICIK